MDVLSRIGALTSADAGSLAHRSLEAVRRHLGMDVAYLSEFVGDRTVFREVDAPGLEHLIAVGESKAIEEVYCQHILAGDLPELIPDTAAIPLAAAMPITSAVPIGAHVSVPIRRADGAVYGMFCCLSATPRRTLNERDLHIVRAFAAMVADEIARDTDTRAARTARTARVRAALAPDALSIHLQPICHLAGGQPVSYEALSRFALTPLRKPDEWFADAAAAGLAVELECAALAAALDVLPFLPDPLTLSVNASPETLASGAFGRLVETIPVDRLTLELTEHAVVADYDRLNQELAPLRARGLKLAIDDAGAGFSGLQHILRLEPDVIKLDMALIQSIDVDPARRALAAAMQMFARQTGATLVAEGVETHAELATLARLGFLRVQGYLLGRPVPAADVIAGLRGGAVAACA